MKKIIITILLVVMGNLFSQLPLGLNFGMTKAQVQNALVKSNTMLFMDREDILVFRTENKIAGENATLLMGVFFENKMVKFGITFEDELYYDVVSTYNKIQDIISKKYKMIDNTKTFYDPYYEGDGYEMQAINNKKGFIYSTFEQVIESKNLVAYISVNSKNSQVGCVALHYSDKEMFQKYLDDKAKKEASEL